MPGVHPALGLGALPPGVEEALLTYPGLLPSAPALMVEGINSNLAAAQHASVACLSSMPQWLVVLSAPRL